MKLPGERQGNCAVLIDLDKSKPIAILMKRTQEKSQGSIANQNRSIGANRGGQHRLQETYEIWSKS